MAGTKETLGIELQLSLDGKFSDLIKQIEKAFGNIDLKGFEGKVAGLEGKLTGVTGKLNKMAAEFERLTGGTQKQFKLDLDASGVNKSLASASKQISEFKNSLVNVDGQLKSSLQHMLDNGNQISAIIKNTNKAYTDQGNSIIAATKNTDKFFTDRGTQIWAATKNTQAAQKAEVDSYIKRGEAIIAAERNTLKAIQEARSAQSQPAREFLAGLSNQGLKYNNGNIIPKSYEVNPNKAHEEALSINTKTNLASMGLTGNQSAQWAKDIATQSAQAQKYLESLGKQGFSFVNGEIVKTSKSASLFGQSLGNVARHLAEFYLIRGAYFSVRNQIQEAVKASVDFNQSIHDIVAISGESTKSLGTISAAIWDIAKTSRFSSKEVADSMKVMAQAGVAAKDLPETTRVVDRFATSTASDPKMAADLFTTSMNVFNVKAEGSIRISNALTAALNNSKLEASGLATAFNYLAPQAQQLGYSLEQTLGIIATMAQSGIKPSTVGTGVSQMLKEFAAPKQRLKGMLEYYGLTPDEINPLKKDFASIVDSLNNAKGKAGETGVQVNHLFQALESRVGRSAIAAINLTGDAFRNMEKSITGTSSALIAYDKSMDGAVSRMNVVKQHFHELVSTLGEKLAPALIFVVESMRGVIEGIKWLTDALSGGFSGAITSAVLGITSIAAAVAGLHRLLVTIQASAATGGFIAGLLGITAATPIGWITAGIVAVAAAITGLGYAMGKSRREAEETRKSILTNVEANQKYSDSLNKLSTDTREGNEDFKKYQKLMESGNIVEAKALGIADKKIKMTDDTKKALNQLMLTYPEYFAKLKTEIKTYEDLYIAIDAANKLKAKTSVDAKERFNSTVRSIDAQYGGELEELVAKQANIKNNPAKHGRYGTEGTSTDIAVELKELAAREKKVRDAIKKAQSEASVAQDRDLALSASTTEVVKAGKKYDRSPVVKFIKGRTGEIPQIVSQDLAQIDKKESTPGLDLNAKPSTENLQAKAETQNAEYQIRALKLRNDLLKDLAKDTAATTEEVVKYSTEYKLNLIRIDNLRNDKAEFKVQKDFTDEKGRLRKGVSKNTYDELLTNARKEDQQAYEKDLKEGDTFFKELLIKAERSRNEYDQGALELKTKHMKKNSDKEISELERTFKSANVSYEEKYFNASMARVIKEAQIDREVELERLKAKNEFDSLSPADQKIKKPAYDSKLLDINNSAEDRKKVEGTEIFSKLDSSADAVATKYLKDSEIIISKTAGAAKQTLSYRKETATSAEELRKIDSEILDADILANKERGEALRKAIELEGTSEANKEKVADFKEELSKISGLYSELIRKQQDLNNTGFWFNFNKGVTEAWVKLSDTVALTKSLGSSITNTAFNGMTDALVNTTNTIFNPDEEKISQLNTQISSLTTQKNQLQNDIATIEANTVKTPVEIQQLNEKKIKLAEVTAELDKQNKAVRDQTSGWQSFAQGLKKTMTMILEELQKYVAQLMIVAMVKQVAGFATNMFSGPSSGGDYSNLNASGNSFGFQSAFGRAEGGYIPAELGTRGVDSVPTMLMPEEFVVKASSVNKYGVDFLNELNAGRVKKLAEGGSVGGRYSAGTDSDKEKTPFSLTIINLVDPKTIPQKTTGEEIINVINLDLARKGSSYRTLQGVFGK